jgi:hypothetical protein
MDYPFENLNPESFQQFCQALLAKEVPGLQCFPVAQPDGGRDAVAYTQSPGALDFAMYQVKFVRRPQAEQDPHKWLVETMEGEAPKIASQVLKGAKRFYLLTNVAGTAHPGSGSIDKARELLAAELSIPAEVWWRDDLNRRLDNAWDLKWAFPQLMTGTDLMRSLIESGLSEERERRTNAIRAFVSDQYSIDEEVKFKQVELQNRLLDLFIDVPIVVPPSPAGRRQGAWFHSLQFATERAAKRTLLKGRGTGNEISPADVMLHSHERPQIGAATMLLDHTVQERIPFLVLEGAPGQGKSTISQYVAQVHRMRLLNKTEALARIPDEHRCAPVRLPFKVDLRDFATWLSKRDPFTPQSESEEPPIGWQKSLESFLAALVRHHSGGSSFDVTDLHAVAKTSSIVLLLDGLDEVADIPRREEVVHEIARGVKRLRDIAVSLQAVVTSRPAAFANSPGLPDSLFPYFQLDALSRTLIAEYAEKWLHARNLQGKERAEVKQILNDKLSQPHLRDLARNPMQLAILLSLIHTRGSSLPDKRTALYDAYMELFFNREAEKSDIIRDHRDLLIDIHRFVAWRLHVESEVSGSSGSIGAERLESMLREYLASEGHDASIAQLMFRGMVERVVAIVSRVEGTYEFEVQPLREYFAARYLYETAPYSPPGSEKGGTKPDRFDALARDFYWLNVTRFYAGCFSKGELSSLVDRLQDLVKEDGYSRLAHPRMLAATLLSDWVFAQHPRSMREVVALVTDGIGLRFHVSSSRRRVRGSAPLVLPSRSGRDELIARCLEMLRKMPPRDLAADLIDVLRANTALAEMVELWEREATGASIQDRTTWLDYGASMGALPRTSIETATRLFDGATAGRARITAMVAARRWDVLESNQDAFQATVDAALDGDLDKYFFARAGNGMLERFAMGVQPTRYGFALFMAEPAPLKDVWHRHSLPFESEANVTTSPAYPLATKCQRFLDVVDVEVSRFARTWATEIAPWDRVTECMRAEWGERWAAFQLANFAAGIRAPSEQCGDASALCDKGVPLCRRARYARLRAGNAGWWTRQLNASADESDRLLWCTLLLTWGSAATLFALASSVDDALKSLGLKSWHRLFNGVGNSIGLSRNATGDRSLSFDVGELPELSSRGAAAMTLRANEATSESLFLRFLATSSSDDVDVLTVCQAMASTNLRVGKDSDQALALIRRCYAADVLTEDYSQEIFERKDGDGLTIEIATLITDAPDQYPAYLVAAAQRRWQSEVAEKMVSVGKVAERDGWQFT